MKRMVFLAVWVLAVVAPLSAFAKTRGVYVNGQVHFCFLSGQSICHQACAVDTSTWLLSPSPGHSDASLSFSGYRYTAWTYGEGIAVFNDQIYYAFVANTSFSSSAPLHCYVATYDLPSKAWLRVKDLGSVHTDNKSQGHNSGAAVTVLNNTLYVLSDSGIYTSGDGISWASHSPLLSSNYQPLDAITIFPPDTDPMILVLVGYSGDVSNIYNNLDTELWNGQFGDDLVNHGMGVSLGEVVYGHAALFQGTFAGGNSFSAGAKAPVVQLFVNSAASDGPGEVRRAEWTYGATGGSWAVDPHKLTHDSIDDLVSFPWYTTDECVQSPTHPGQYDHAQRQHLAINYYQCTSSSCKDYEWKGMGFTSDALVPLNRDIAISDCSGWGGTGTDTGGSESSPDDMATLRKYWSLVGVVLGSPPFAVNGLSDYEIEDVSNVNYGQDNGTEVSHSQTWENQVLVSAGLSVHAGFFDGLLKIKDQVDLGYKHAWETAHEDSSSSSVGYQITMGTQMSNPNDIDKLGKFGWALFNVPTVVVQDYAVYAYDYVAGGTTGTYLNQDLHTTQVLPDGLSVIPYAFELADPGGPNDDVPGLMAGMGPFARSTDLSSWTSTWESDSHTPTRWTTALGTAAHGEPKVNTLAFSSGTGGSIHFANQTTTVDTSGQTTEVDVSDQLSIEVGTKLKGFGADLEAGYEGNFTTEVTNSTEFGTEVEAEIGMKRCESVEEGCVKSLTIQPFWLQATDPTAPWIPTAYDQQLPWCMAWQVTQMTYEDGATGGTSSPPASVDGKVVGGSGGGERADGATPEADSTKASRYAVKDGRLAWLDADGHEAPIPLSADGFDPASGASVSIQGHAWSTSQAQGKWTRQGSVWKFKTKDSVTRNVATLKLDFASRTWDFDLSKADLTDAFRAAEGRTHLKLTVNGRYTFYCDLSPEITVDWDLESAAQDPSSTELTRYSGSYDTSAGSGSLLLKGHLPAKLESFGDLTLEVNGHRFDVPFLSHKDFSDALERQKVLKVDQGGIHATVDFKERTWTVKIKDGASHRLGAPCWGRARIRLLVGGVPWYAADLPIPNHTTKLKFKG